MNDSHIIKMLDGSCQHCLSKEERLFQAAKAALQAIITRGNYDTSTDAARNAIKYANALLRELEFEKGK